MQRRRLNQAQSEASKQALTSTPPDNAFLRDLIKLWWQHPLQHASSAFEVAQQMQQPVASLSNLAKSEQGPAGVGRTETGRTEQGSGEQPSSSPQAGLRSRPPGLPSQALEPASSSSSCALQAPGHPYTEDHAEANAEGAQLQSSAGQPSGHAQQSQADQQQKGPQLLAASRRSSIQSPANDVMQSSDQQQPAEQWSPAGQQYPAAQQHPAGQQHTTRQKLPAAQQHPAGQQYRGGQQEQGAQPLAQLTAGHPQASTVAKLQAQLQQSPQTDAPGLQWAADSSTASDRAPASADAAMHSGETHDVLTVTDADSTSQQSPDQTQEQVQVLTAGKSDPGSNPEGWVHSMEQQKEILHGKVH